MVTRARSLVLGLSFMLSLGASRYAPAISRGAPKRAARNPSHPADNLTVARMVEKVIFWGLVSGRPVRKIYRVVSASHTTRVDIGRARIRSGGKPVPASRLTPGTFVRVTGTMSGETFHAAEVNIILRPTRETRKHRAVESGGNASPVSGNSRR